MKKISLWLEEDDYMELKRMSHEISLEHEETNLSDLIRSAVKNRIQTQKIKITTHKIESE